jgi:hypothetical protein
MNKCWACLVDADPPGPYGIAYIAGAVEARTDGDKQRESLCAEHQIAFDEFTRIALEEEKS